MINLFNISSFLLGLVAWIIPVVNLIRYEKQNHKNLVALSIISISACAISLCFQIFNIYHLVQIEDWSALMDTMGALAIVSAILLNVTIVLNAITLIVYRNRVGGRIHSL